MPGVNDLDPTTAESGADFVKLIRRLIIAAGAPSIRELSRTANAAEVGSLPHSTLSDVLRKGELPQWRIMDPLLRAVGVSPQRQDDWRDSWELLREHGENALAGDSAHPATRAAERAVPLSGDREHCASIRPDQSDQAAGEFALWLERSSARPKVHRNEERTGIVEISYFWSVQPSEARQFSKEHLQAGESVRCFVKHPLIEPRNIIYCFASGGVADQVTAKDLPQFFRARIRCLGPIIIGEISWDLSDEEERDTVYDAAYSIDDLTYALGEKA